MITLIQCTKEAGHGDKTQQEWTVKAIFLKAVAIAKDRHGITQTASGWKKKYNRIRKEYGMYVAKIRQSGREGDDPVLYDKSNIFEEIHELEPNNARHNPPALISTSSLAEGTDDGSVMSSIRKCAKREDSTTLIEMEKQTESRHNELLMKVKEGNEHKTFGELMKKF